MAVLQTTTRPTGCADHTLWVTCMASAAGAGRPEERAERLFPYLEVFPTGRHNRAVTEALEACLDDIAEPATRAALEARLRSLRDPFFPAILPLPHLSDPPPSAAA